MSYKIKKAAVLGSGVMGAGIACHLANAGIEVLMLDIVPFDLTKKEANNPAARNKIVNGALKAALKSKPAALYTADYAKRITTGNFDDDFEKIADADWIIEVVIENLKIKKEIFKKVDKLRKKDSLVTSNTSGIPIKEMNPGRSQNFREHFCGTHFFNPPRYLKLFEIIPGPDTKKEVIDFFMDFGGLRLGKQSVLAKDTPAFIGNRVGMYSLAKLLRLAEDMDLTIEEVDKLTGPLIGRPKTGTFRLMDLVGNDTGEKVSVNLIKGCPKDKALQKLRSAKTPRVMKFLLDNKFLGDKTGQGFYKKTKDRDKNGRRIVQSLDLNTLKYRDRLKPTLDSLKYEKSIDNLKNRLPKLLAADDKGGAFLRSYFGGLFAYVSNRIPEIANDIYSIDNAMKAGYAWDIGPFEYWDMLGIKKGIELAESQGEKVAKWVKDMAASRKTSFYKSSKSGRKYFDKKSKTYETIPGTEDFLLLESFRGDTPVLKNSECTLHDVGDGVLLLEFTSKSNSIGEGIGQGLAEAIRMAEEDGWNGVLIGNDAANFSVGANLMMVAMLAYQKEYKKIEELTNNFQQVNMLCRYSNIPVVAAIQGYTFGGACEMAMHCDSVQAAAETYIGMPEVGVGLLPGGAGTKEFTLRASDSYFKGDVMMPTLIERFRTIATAHVATSAIEGFKSGFLDEKKDNMIIQGAYALMEGKQKVLDLARNYAPGTPRKDIKVLGRTGLATLLTAINEFKLGEYMSEHDALIARKVAYIMCGGDLTGTQEVSEQYLLDLEREAFMSLIAEQKSLDRIQYMLENNRPLRN